MPAVTKGRELWFLGLFLVQYLGGLALLYWQGLRTDELTLLEAAALATALIIMSTAHAVVIVEGIAMLAESFLKRRYEAGLQEGREEGIQVGRRENQQRWEEWNRRRLEAEARGERFEEPPPGEYQCSITSLP